MEKSLIELAADFAELAHAGQRDDEGNPYFAHVEQVVRIVVCVVNDPEIIAAAYLHDVLEDTVVKFEELVEKFGSRVAGLVLEVTHAGSKDVVGYYFPNLKSRDAILIKFADRLSNLSRMGSWDLKRVDHYLKRSKFWKDAP